ncbi:hypothetical protein SDC9_39147 [bioreactor metagenome]|uniref:Uncharacterized protein n=1 Tax=bioreactor metagenome TaxID=1076179 RepID=A0A644VRG6_9ZZZZ
MGSVARVLRFRVFRPVLHLVGEVGARHVREVFRHVDRVLIRQPPLPERELAMRRDRHVLLDEGGGGEGAGHAGADVEGMIAPERRIDHAPGGIGQPLAILAMAGGALLGIDRLAAHRVGDQRGIDLAHAAALDLVLWLGLALHPVEIGQHRLHVGAVLRQRLAVHRAAEAAVDAVLHVDHLARPLLVGGEEGGDADIGRAVRHRARVQVARGAVQRIADMLGQQVAGLGIQPHAAHQLLGVRRAEHRGEPRRLEGRAVDRGADRRTGLGHCLGRHRGGALAEVLAHEAEDLRDLLIAKLGKARHVEGARMRRGHRALPAGQGDVDERRGIFGRDRVVATEGREDAGHALAVRTVAIRAELRIAKPARRGPGGLGHQRGHHVGGACRLLRPVGGQRFHVDRHRRQIEVGEMLRRMRDHVDHAARDSGKAVLPGLQQPHHVGDGPQVAQVDGVPVLDLRARQELVALRPGAVHGDLLEADAARRVAGAAMAEALHQIGAAVPHRILRRIRGEGGAFQEGGVPVGHAPALVERETEVGFRRGLFHRRKALAEIGPERAHVGLGHLGIGGIGHRRIEVPAVRRHALAHRAVELGIAPAADAGLGIGGDVGRVNRAHRAFEGKAPRHLHPVLRGVTGDAIAKLGDVAAARDQIRACRAGEAGRHRLERRRPGEEQRRPPGQHRDHPDGGCIFPLATFLVRSHGDHFHSSALARG